MNENNHVNQWVFAIIIAFFVGMLGIIWTKLEKIDDALSEVKTDVALIKQRIEGVNGTGSLNLLDRMYK